MTVQAKVVEVERGYSLKIVSGYRAGNFIEHADAGGFIQPSTNQNAVVWPNRLAAVLWAESTGYTVVNKGE